MMGLAVHAAVLAAGGVETGVTITSDPAPSMAGYRSSRCLEVRQGEGAAGSPSVCWRLSQDLVEVMHACLVA
jgi:hypothetical protein